MGRHDTPSPVVPDVVASAKLESGEDQRKRRAILRDATSFARRFADADQDFDQKLSFAEFLMMMPPRLRDQFSDEEFRVWFDQVDIGEGSGYLTIEEYFLVRAASANADDVRPGQSARGPKLSTR